MHLRKLCKSVPLSPDESCCWWARRDLNPQPRDYESPALTVELQALPFYIMLTIGYL